MTVDLQTGEQYAPRPTDYCTRATAVVPAGDCPLWHAFLHRVTDGDADMQAYLQRAAGYWLTGHTTEHALFFLYGTGANGKSVFTETILRLWGDYATTAPMETFVEARGERHPTEIAGLRGVRLVIASETEAGRHWNESRIKALTGGETVAARFMRQDFFTYRPQFKLVIVGNHKPSLRNVDEAMRRRFHLIPFTVTIPPEERDPLLSEKLKAEWPGILRWAVDGCLAWRAQGLNPPKAVIDATEEYLKAEDSLGAWLEECTALSSDWAFELSADLFASWKQWADKAGEPSVSRKKFSEALQARGYRLKKGTGGVRGFEGIRLKRADYSNDPRAGD